MPYAVIRLMPYKKSLSGGVFKCLYDDIEVERCKCRTAYLRNRSGNLVFYYVYGRVNET